MLKQLLILAMFGASLWGAKPVLGQSPDHRSDPSHNPKNPTTNSQSPSKPTLTILEKNCDREQFKNDADCKSTEDKEHSIAISKLPTANVTVETNPERNVADWIAYFGNIAVLIVGIWGIRVALRGVKATEKAADAALKSADAANDQIKLMKNRERARFRIEFKNVKIPERPTKDSFQVIGYEIHMDGLTRATVLEARISARIVESYEFTFASWNIINMPRSVTPSEKPSVHQEAILTGHPVSFECPSPSLWKSVKEDNFVVLIDGRILFEDVFGDRWVYGFRRHWREYSNSVPVPDSRFPSGFWQVDHEVSSERFIPPAEYTKTV